MALTILLFGASARAEITVGGSAGGFVPFSDLEPTVVVGVEAAWSRGPLGAALAVDAAQPSTDGRAGDASYSLRARQLRFALLAQVRWPDLAVRPFAAAGPALLLVETRESGRLDGQHFGTTRERSVHFGAVLSAGVETELGPGLLFGAATVGLGVFDGTLTGDASAGSLELRAGYRFRL